MPDLRFLLPVVAALIFGSWAFLWGASSVFEGCVSSTWPHTIGAILESEVGSSSSKGRSYFPAITYTYSVEGHSYQNSKVGGRSVWNLKKSQEVVEANRSGTQRPVYYSPSDPGNSLLIPGLHCASFFGIILGTLIYSIGALLGTVGYLAPKYGTYSEGSYNFTFDSFLGRIAITGFLALAAQFGLLFCVLQ